MKTITLKLGFHRNNPRLWIEGKQLAAIGFTVGTAFRADFRPGKVILTVDALGDRTVSGRARKGEALPIVDINCNELRSALGSDCTTVTVELKPQTILARKERAA